MCLRDRKIWLKERLYGVIVWVGEPSVLSKDEAEKRERLVQTYLVVFGLLLSYSGNPDLQAGLMKFFIAFLIASLVYYSMLARSAGSKRFRNLMALSMGVFFSSAFVSCYVAFANHPVGMWLLFFMIAYTVALPLLV